MVDDTDLDQFASQFDQQTAGRLSIISVPVGERFLRMIRSKYPSGLGVGFGSTRFSDPRYKEGVATAQLFRTLYATSSLETAFDEVILRDLRDGIVGPLVVSRAELASFDVCDLVVQSELRLVNLTHPAGRLIGIPTDVTGHSHHALSQRYAYALHQHREKPDGIAYRSRFTHEFNIAVFDRALDRTLAEADRRALLKYDLGKILRDRHVGVARA